MNPAFDEVLAAGSDAMLSAFDTTAQRLALLWQIHSSALRRVRVQ
jgi:hypothetical protein